MPRYVIREKSNYTGWNLMLDVFLTVVTGGLWIFWIVIREWRRR